MTRRPRYPVRYFHLFTPDDSVVAYAEANPVDKLILVPGSDQEIQPGERWGVLAVKFGITHQCCAADGFSHRVSLELVDKNQTLIAAAQEEIPGFLVGTLPTPQYPLMGDGFQTPWLTVNEPGIFGRADGSPLYLRQTNLTAARQTGFYILDVVARRLANDDVLL